MSEGEGFTRRVTLANLSSFAPLLKKRRVARQGGGTDTETDNEQTSDSANEGTEGDPELAAAEALFGGESIKTGIRYSRPPRGCPEAARETAVRERPRPGAKPQPATAPRPHGLDLLWRKLLSKTDAQRQTGNPTGDLRLVQARFPSRNTGEVINQTRYFRYEVFGGLEWQPAGVNPYRERASAEFEVVINGRSHGRHELTISHKPSGEAGQGNYTTGVNWGEELGHILRTVEDVSGEVLSLYGPGDGSGPYRIEIAETEEGV